jgi:hypothetical protein
MKQNPSKKAAEQARGVGRVLEETLEAACTRLAVLERERRVKYSFWQTLLT